MFPKKPINYSGQRGFLVPLAAIIVVGLGVLAIAISRLSGQAASATTQEGLAVQAYYAADSGAQYAMNRIFFNTDKATANANCGVIDLEPPLSYSATALALCSSEISCSVSTIASSDYYVITSAATCGSGDSFAERTIAVSAYMP